MYRQHRYQILLIFIIFSFEYCTNNNSHQQPCIFEYNSRLISSGEVFSPNYPKPYPNNLNCRYEFYGKANERVIIIVEDFQLEPPQNTAVEEINFMDVIETNTRSMPSQAKLVGTNESVVNNKPLDDDSLYSNRQCFYDFLDVFTTDGGDRIFWRSRHCGSKIDSQIVSTSPALFLIFQTDRMLNYRGFKLKFHFSNLNILPFVTQPICGPSEITGNGSLLNSPYYPYVFPSNTDCAWTITVKKGENILIKFLDVNLSPPCQLSYISIWDGYVSDVNKPDKLVCEKLSYYTKGIMHYKSKTNRIVIKFTGNKDQEKLNDNDEPVTDAAKLEDSNNQTSITKKKNLKYKSGFSLSWTAVKLDDNCPEFKCKGGEYCIDSKNFLCQQTYQYCISKKLVCDGVLNCDLGDDSDEKHCQLTYLHSKLYLSLSIICAIVFVLITVTCVIVHNINAKKLADKSKIENVREEETKTHNNHNSGHMPVPTYVDPRILNEKKKSLKQYNDNDNDDGDDDVFKIEYRGLSRSLSKDSNKQQQQQSDVIKNDELNERSERKLKKQNSRERDSLDKNTITYKSFYNKSEEPLLLSNTNETSRRASTPTYSSSVASLSPPYDITESKSNVLSQIVNEKPKQQQNQRHHNQSETPFKKPKIGLNNNIKKKINSQISHLLLEDDTSSSLRRNSYTKAIFFDN